MTWTDNLNHGPRRLVLGGHCIEILHWAHSPRLPDNVRHRHTYHEVCQVGRCGRGVFTVQGQPHEIAPGDVFFARPGVLHQIQNTGPQLMELFWVSFIATPQAATKEPDVAATFSASPLLVAPAAKDVAAIWQALRAVSEAPPRASSTAPLQNLMAALLLALMQAGTENQVLAGWNETQTDHHSLAHLAVRYIQDNIERRLPVEEVAGYVHVSPRHLSRLLREFTGVSPASYIEQARMDRACALLLKESTPIKAVASQSGYGDVHHFTRVFRRRCGVAPGEFRRRGFQRAIVQPGDLV